MVRGYTSALSDPSRCIIIVLHPLLHVDFIVWFGDFNYRVVETVCNTGLRHVEPQLASFIASYSSPCFLSFASSFHAYIPKQVSAERCFEQAYGDEADLEQLRQQDQLNIERAAGRSFHGFAEGVLSFRPTYKFQPGTDLYEQRPEKKLRTPAWCDRILWRCGDGVDPRHLRQVR